MKPKFIISNVLITAWKKAKSQFWILAGLFIGYCILFFTLSVFARPAHNSTAGILISNLLLLGFSTIFYLGYLKNIFQALDDEEPQFAAYGQEIKHVIPYIGASFIYTIVVLIGCLLFILPGIYLALRLQFYLALIVEEHAGITDSLRKSWEITRSQSIPLFLLMVIQLCIILLGIVLFGIGVFVAIPVVYMSYGYAFRQLNATWQI